MKRWLFFLAVLVIIFFVSFALSLLAFPNWPNQPNWVLRLTIAIIIAGVGIVGSEILTKLISFLFDDKDFNERLLFIVGNKYKEISKRLDEVSQFEINKEKRSKKYIPNIFVESTDVKEKLRYFSEPFIFFLKLVEQTARSGRTSFIFETLNQIHYPSREPQKPKVKQPIRNKKTLKQNIEKYKKYLEQKKAITSVLIKEGGTGLKPEYKFQIPSEFSHVYDYAGHKLQYYRLFEHYIEDAKDDLDLLTNKIIIIKGIAGHGKTNLLCDFTENFVLKKGHKCLYISARELNFMGELETIEQAINRIIFGESDYQFSDILRLIKYDRSIDNFFLLIDGINEHKNFALFSVALEQFIQRCIGYDIKVILTCRSEYFDDRFGNLMNIENLSLLDLDDRKNTHEIPEVYQNVLLEKYFSEFDIQMQPNHVNPSVVETFYQDKLLLRIFCEAYESEQIADYLDDLYKLEIFNRYFEKKQEAINGLVNCLDEIISWMLAHDEYTNIRISNLSRGTIEIIEATVYENVIIKKDIIATPGLALSGFEVVNFVYDEFRDYLIASGILLTWDQNQQQAKELIQRLTQYKSVVSEGLQRYLCLWSIKNKRRDLLEFMNQFDWFEPVFIDSVFESPDFLLPDFMTDLLRQMFASSPDNTLYLIFYLKSRANVEQYPNLNIEFLFECFGKLSESDYQSVLSDALNKEYDYKTSFLSHLCNIIVKAFQDDRVSEVSEPYLIQLLSYLIVIRNEKQPTFPDYDFEIYPVKNAILEISNIIGEQKVLAQVHSVLQVIGIVSVEQKLHEMLVYLGEE